MSGCAVDVDADIGTRVIATEDVAVRQPLISVPKELFLSFESAKENGFAQVLRDYPQLEQVPDEILAAHLMVERRRGTSSKWAPYIAALPRVVDTPIDWDDAELDVLEGTTLKVMVGAMRSGLKRDYDNIHEPLISAYEELLGGLTYDDYVWAMTMVFSRAFSLKGRKYMVPVLDSFNHSPGPVEHLEDVVDIEEEDGVPTLWTFRAADAFSTGSECTGVYGVYSNAKLLYSYGFVLRSAAASAASVDFWVKPMPTDPQRRAKEGLLARCPHDEKLFSFDFRGSIRERHIAPRLLWSARIIALAPDEMQSAQDAFRGMVSPENEKAAYESLRGSLSAKLAQMGNGAGLDELDGLEEAMTSGSAPEPVAAVGTQGAWADKTISDAQKAWRAKARKYAALVVLDDEVRVTRSCVELLDEWLEKLREEGEAYVVPDARPASLPQGPGGARGHPAE